MSIKNRKGIVLYKSNVDGMGIVKEFDDGSGRNTQTEYIFDLNDLSKEQLKTITTNSHVEFTRDEDFEQFMIKTIRLIHPTLRQVI